MIALGFRVNPWILLPPPTPTDPPTPSFSFYLELWIKSKETVGNSWNTVFKQVGMSFHYKCQDSHPPPPPPPPYFVAVVWHEISEKWNRKSPPAWMPFCLFVCCFLGEGWPWERRITACQLELMGFEENPGKTPSERYSLGPRMSALMHVGHDRTLSAAAT